MQKENIHDWSEIDQNLTKKVENRAEMTQKKSKKCVSYRKNPTQEKKHRTYPQILLLVPKPTWHLVPRCRNNFQLWLHYSF